MRNSLKLIFENMVNGCSLRKAVPYGNHPNPVYRKHWWIDRTGADASDHQQFLTYKFLFKEVEK